MRRTLARFIIASTVALSFAVPSAARAQESGIAVGRTAPPASVQTLDGKAANLSQWIGKGPVLLEFWATWCPNCKELEPRMAAAQKKYGDRVHFVAVAVSVNQSPERVRRHLARSPLPMTVVYDNAGQATDVYEAPATSYVVVLDALGTVVYTGLGGTQDLDAAIAKAGVR